MVKKWASASKENHLHFVKLDYERRIQAPRSLHCCVVTAI